MDGFEDRLRKIQEIHQSVLSHDINGKLTIFSATQQLIKKILEKDVVDKEKLLKISDSGKQAIPEIQAIITWGGHFQKSLFSSNDITLHKMIELWEPVLTTMFSRKSCSFQIEADIGKDRIFTALEYKKMWSLLFDISVYLLEKSESFTFSTILKPSSIEPSFQFKLLFKSNNSNDFVVYLKEFSKDIAIQESKDEILISF